MKFFGFLFASVVLTHSVQAHDIVLRDQSKAVLGVSYPSNWKQVIDEFSVTATSEDGQAWSLIRTLDEIQDEAAGTKKVKAGLNKRLKEIQYSEPVKTENGVLILAGTGKEKESGDEVVFTSRVFRSGQRYCGILFIVDAKAGKDYQKNVLAICESILVEEDFAKNVGDRPAADSSNLFAQPWLVETISGGGVVDQAQTTIAFSEDGSVSGSTSVNRFRGSVTLDGNKLSFGPLATTRRAGPPALMDQESKFLKAVETVVSFQIETTGLLSLRNENGDTVLRLSPLEAAERQ